MKHLHVHAPHMLLSLWREDLEAVSGSLLQQLWSYSNSHTQNTCMEHAVDRIVP